MYAFVIVAAFQNFCSRLSRVCSGMSNSNRPEPRHISRHQARSSHLHAVLARQRPDVEQPSSRSIYQPPPTSHNQNHGYNIHVEEDISNTAFFPRPIESSSDVRPISSPSAESDPPSYEQVMSESFSSYRPGSRTLQRTSIFNLPQDFPTEDPISSNDQLPSYHSVRPYT